MGRPPQNPAGGGGAAPTIYQEIVPTVDVEKRAVSKNSVEMLKQDLWGEDNAIKRYKERIAQAEALKEYGLRRVLEDILIQEEEHKRDLVNALAK